MNGLNPQKFTVLDDFFAKDETAVYTQGMRVLGADPATFEILWSGYGKDRNFVYNLSQKVEGANPKTFVVPVETTKT